MFNRPGRLFLSESGGIAGQILTQKKRYIAERMMLLSPQEILKKYWGYQSFRPFQKEIIGAVLAKEDVLAILPTGAGKSLCYQVPAVMLDGVCLVISPLIALMQDQVKNLTERGIPAACIHTAMTPGEISETCYQAEQGDLKLLYISPERLKVNGFLEFILGLKVSLIAVDEAHCISQWGHDFRPSYLEISELRTELSAEIPWMALTATATPKVKQEIVQYLGMPAAKVFRQSIYRENLSYRVVQTESKLNEIVKLFRESQGSSILYCPTRKKCMEMKHWLELNQIKALAYHAGLPKEERSFIQSKWTNADDFVICATSAFGMGIDKENVSVVAHLSPPESLEAYYQEAGRAGRNGKPAKCILYYAPDEIRQFKELPFKKYPPKHFVLKVYQQLCDFLQIPLGSGVGEAFAFNAVQFARKWELDLVPVINAIKILEKEDILLWEADGRLPSTIQVLASESELEELRRIYPELHQIVIAILRIHDGVFNFPARLKIWEVSQYLRIEQVVIISGVKRLHQLGILQFKQNIEDGYLTFQTVRRAPSQLPLDGERIKKLKIAFEERIEQMIAYLENQSACRNRQLAYYFGESEIPDCRQCDNCKKKFFSSRDVKLFNRQLLEKLQESPANTLQNLSSHFPEIAEDLLIDQLRNLQQQGYCRILPNGNIILK